MRTESKKRSEAVRREGDTQARVHDRQSRSRLPIPFGLKLLQLGMRSLDTVSPRLAGRWAYHLWFATHRFPEPNRETRWREQAQQFTLSDKHGPLTLYSWGEGPMVLLVHGWNGRGTQMGAFAAPLVDAGYRAIAFDAPAHGRTPGNSTTIFRIIDAVNNIAQQLGPIKGVITHSFGAMVIVRALRTQLSADRIVCISPPAQLDYLIESFSKTLRVPARAQKIFVQRLEKDFGADIWTQVSAEVNAANLSVPALIIHDEHDPDVPIQQGQRLAKAWPGARFLATRGLGHNRILRHRGTVQTAVDFVRDAG